MARDALAVTGLSLALLLAAGTTAACYTQPPAPMGLRSSNRNVAPDDEDEEEDDEGGSGTATRKSGQADHSEHAKEGGEVDESRAQNAGAAGNAFTGAPAYTSGSPPHSANDHHATSMTGRACLACHDGSTAPRFAFAGTVYRRSAPAARAQIRVIDAAGAVQGSVYSDADGNFWLERNVALRPGKTGARSATGTTLMKTSVSGGDCNSSSCHGPSNRISVP